MVFKVIFLFILVGHLLKSYMCFSDCTFENCQTCFSQVKLFVPDCTICITPCVIASVIPVICNNSFSVSIISNGSTVQEGASLTLTCVHNLPNVTSYEWIKDNSKVEDEISQMLVIEKALSKDNGQYACVVHSVCGSYQSEPLGVTVDANGVIILVVCGCAALVLVVIMGIAMKFKMHRDKVKNKQRTKQRLQEMRRAQDLQNRGALPNPAPTS